MVFAQERYAEDRAKPDLLLHFPISIFRISQDIGDLDRFAFEYRSPDNAAPSRFERNAHTCFPMSGRAAVSCDGLIVRAQLAMHRRHVGLAQPRRRFRQCVEHRLQIKSRTTDHFEHVGGGSLLLQRLTQLIKQARVLNGDDSLVGERSHQLDLLVGKGRDPLTGQIHHADRLALAHQRNAKQSPYLRNGDRFRKLVVGIGSEIGDLHRSTLLKNTPHDCSASCCGAENGGIEESPLEIDRVICKCGASSDCRHETKNVAFATRDEGHLRLTEPSCALGKRVENGLKVEGRTTYQLEYVRGRGLLPQRFGEIGCALAQFIEQPRVLDGDDRLRGKRLEKRNLLIRKRINLGTSKYNCSDRCPLAEQWNSSNRPMSEPSREGASFGK